MSGWGQDRFSSGAPHRRPGGSRAVRSGRRAIRRGGRISRGSKPEHYAGRPPLLRAPLSGCQTLWREVLIGGSSSTPQRVHFRSPRHRAFRSDPIGSEQPSRLSCPGWANSNDQSGLKESREIRGGPGCCLCSVGKERRAGTYKSRRGAGQGSTGSSVGEKPSSHPERGDRSEYATDTGAHGASIVREKRRLCIRAADLSTLTVPGWPKWKSRFNFCGGNRSPTEHDPE